MAIGSLPGDDAVPSQEDVQEAKVAASASCAPPPVTTDDVVMIGWVNASVIDLPDGANFLLRNALSTPGACSALLFDWLGQIPTFLFNKTDKAYANAFLLKHSANVEPPPSINPDTILAGAIFVSSTAFRSSSQHPMA